MILTRASARTSSLTAAKMNIVNAALQVASRLSLPGLLALAAGLRIARLGTSHNLYYTATVSSMARSWHNFFFASFDPFGIVSVDKPPLAFWLSTIPARAMGVTPFSVSLVNTLAGIASVLLLYWLLRPAFGKACALAAGAALAVMPVAVTMDSRNDPDSLVLFFLLLAVLCLSKAARRDSWAWLLGGGAVIGLAFNTKLWLAVVPLPAMLAFYSVQSRCRRRYLFPRLLVFAGVAGIVSIAWLAAVGLTPPADRPYTGSTPDNSVWTLVFDYNALRRLTGFIPPAPGPLPLPASGLAGLFEAEMAMPLGGLLFVVLAGLLLGLVANLGRKTLPAGEDNQGMKNNAGTKTISHRQGRLWYRLVETMSHRQGRLWYPQLLLWAGWLLTALAIFGLASSTRTHTYYLDQLAPPLAAMLGIVLVDGLSRYRRRGRLAWAFPVLLLAGGLYQIYAFRETMPGWTAPAMAAAVVAFALVLAIALVRRASSASPAMIAAVAASALLLVLPLATSASRSGIPLRGLPPGQPPSPGAPGFYQRPLAKPPGPGTWPGPQPGPKPPWAKPKPPPPRGGPAPPGRPPFPPFLAEAVARHLEETSEKSSAVGAVTANQAAPLILRGIPAVAIGGFSGRDPVFSVDSFESMASRIGLRYFIIGPGAGTARDNPQSRILTHITRTWQDVSSDLGLPAGRVYRKP